MEDDAEACHERTDNREADAGQHRLDGSSDIESHHKFEFADGRNQVALVHAARLVVDVEHAAADHHRDVHGERDVDPASKYFICTST